MIPSQTNINYSETYKVNAMSYKKISSSKKIMRVALLNTFVSNFSIIEMSVHIVPPFPLISIH